MIIQRYALKFGIFPSEAQVHQIYHFAPWMLIGHCFGASLIGLLSLGQSANWAVLLWGVAHLLSLVWNAGILFAYRQAQAKTHKHILFTDMPCVWGRWYLSGALFSGMTWSLVILLLANSQQPQYHTLLIASVFAIAGAAVITLGSVFVIYQAFILPILLGLTAWAWLQESMLYTAISAICVVYLLHTSMVAWKLNQSSQNVHLKNQEIQRTQIEILAFLGRAGEYRDTETGEHIKRMSKSCYLLALQAGLGHDFSTQILYASPLHDVGKIGIADNILLKPGKLTSDELHVMRSHPLIGRAILDGYECDIINMAKRIAETHHERWDGKGYPYGLAGKNIPIEGRITSICDVFDALTSARPYKEAWSYEQAIDYIRDQSGAHFDPELTQHFLAILPKILALRGSENFHQQPYQPCTTACFSS